ncbi:MAG: site-2 protease family protein [Firmicutes bacterium]|nr:site-2 protease family protein [Bacillota bacterium]
MLRNYRISPLTLVCMLFIVVNRILNNPYGSVREWLVQTILALPAILIAISFHEFAHAKVAELSGDDVPRRQGRVTLNPVAHIDPVGFFCLLFIGFGWGRPVEINAENFKKKRLDLLLVSLAGVTMNILLAFVFCGLWVLLAYKTALFNGDFGDILYTVFQNIVVINLVLCVFNLIPVPPLDGFNVVTEIFNLRQTKFYHYAYQYGFIVLMILIVFNFTDYLLTPAVSWLFRTIVGVFV